MDIETPTDVNQRFVRNMVTMTKLVMDMLVYCDSR